MTAEANNHRAEEAHKFLCEAEILDEKRKYGQAFSFFLRSAQLGDAGAQVNLGNYYAAGRGTRKNLLEAARWYRRAYKAGASAGANNLACDQRDHGNYRSAILWFKKAIALKDGDAAVELAKMQHKRGQRPQALAALEMALGMGRCSISKDGREEAELLLKQLQS